MRRRTAVLAALLLPCFIVCAVDTLGQPAADLAPIGLVDADGQELILDRLDLRVAIYGFLSYTEMELAFRNPEERRIEGRFHCDLPAGAVVSRFAKEVNGSLMEGEVVERLRANRVYEEVLNEMRDPALLEQDQGNRFSMRIFPIEAKSTVRIVLGYSRPLPATGTTRRYDLPIRGIDRIGSFAFSASITSLPGESLEATTFPLAADASGALQWSAKEFTPSSDIELRWVIADPRPAILQAGDFYLASLRPDLPSASRIAPHEVVLYVDTSASSAVGAEHRVRALEDVVRHLPDTLPVRALAFDQDVVELCRGSASQVAAQLDQQLRARRFLGGTNLERVLQHVTALSLEDPRRLFVLVTDGIATAGSTDSSRLATLAAGIYPGTTVHALVPGSRIDTETLALITEGRGRIVRVPFTTRLGAHAVEAAGELMRPHGSTVEVDDPASAWVHPTRLTDVGAGDEIIVAGRLRGSSDAAPVVRGLTFDLATARRLPITAGLALRVEREGWHAELQRLRRQELAAALAADRQLLAKEQVAISVRQRVMIPRTTMLVLESEADYRRFGIDRSELGRILTIGKEGVVLTERAQVELPEGKAGGLSGTVVVEGDPLPGVTVTARTRTGAIVRTTVSDTAGRYRFPGLPPGDYVVVMELDGMTSVRRDVRVEGGSIDLPLQEVATHDTQEPAAPPDAALEGELGTQVDANEMSVSSVAEAITVTAAAPGILETTEVQSNYVHSNGFAWPLPAGAGGGGYSYAAPAREKWVRKGERVESLERELKKAPTHRDVYSRLGESLANDESWTRLQELTVDWQRYDPENPQVYELLGEAAMNLGRKVEAVRAAASLAELAASKPELLQRAGLLLLRAGAPADAEEPLRRAVDSRPDRINAWRHLAIYLWQTGRHAEAVDTLEKALQQEGSVRQGNVRRVILEELGYVMRSWLASGGDRSEIEQRAAKLGVDLARTDALRVTLAWETDANDVDLHVIDPKGDEVYYARKSVRSGLELYEDITRGFGPEVARSEKTRSGTYRVGVNYFSAGPMGVSRGIVIVYVGNAAEPEVTIFPFRLAPGKEGIRPVANVELQ